MEFLTHVPFQCPKSRAFDSAVSRRTTHCAGRSTRTRKTENAPARAIRQLHGLGGLRVKLANSGAWYIGVVITVMLAGCSLPQRSSRSKVNPDTLADATFLHYMSTVPVPTIDEGIRAVLLLRGSTNAWPTTTSRIEEMARLGGLNGHPTYEADQVLSKGALARMLRVACDLPSGLNERIAEKTQIGVRRYAFKSCVYYGLLPSGTATDLVTGSEVVAAIRAAERYVADRSSQP